MHSGDLTQLFSRLTFTHSGDLRRLFSNFPGLTFTPSGDLTKLLFFWSFRTHIHAFWFDIYTGDIYYFSRRQKSFILIEDNSVRRGFNRPLKSWTTKLVKDHWNPNHGLVNFLLQVDELLSELETKTTNGSSASTSTSNGKTGQAVLKEARRQMSMLTSDNKHGPGCSCC